MTSISNLRIRSIQKRDFETYYQLVSDPAIARGAHFEPARDCERGKQLFRDDCNGAKVLAITLNNQMIGMIALYPTIGNDSGPNYDCLELAYMMLPKYQKHHYMTEAMGMLITRLKTASRVKRLVALVDENNVASRKVLEKHRFKNYRSVLDLNSGSENLVFELDLK